MDRELLGLIQRREQHRTARKYAEADALREQLLADGVQVYDTPQGVRWRRISNRSDHVRAPDRSGSPMKKVLNRGELSLSLLYSCERMAINRDDVVHAARLARLGLTDEEIDGLTSELDHILEAMRALSQLDTSAIPPTAQVIPLHNVMREDTTWKCSTVDEILLNAPATCDGQFLVPPVLE